MDETDSALDARWLLRYVWQDEVMKVWPQGTFKLQASDKPRATHYLFRLGYTHNGMWAFWVRDLLRSGYPTRPAARMAATVRLRACLVADASHVISLAAYDTAGTQAYMLRDKANDLRRIAAKSYRGQHYKA